MLYVFYILVLLVAIAGLLLFRSPKPPQVEDKGLEVPTPEIGKPIGILFGTRLISSPSIAWYGDVRIKKEKVDANGKK